MLCEVSADPPSMASMSEDGTSLTGPILRCEAKGLSLPDSRGFSARAEGACRAPMYARSTRCAPLEASMWCASTALLVRFNGESGYEHIGMFIL